MLLPRIRHVHEVGLSNLLIHNGLFGCLRLQVGVAVYKPAHTDSSGLRRERPAVPRHAPLISLGFAEAASDEATSRRCGC